MNIVKTTLAYIDDGYSYLLLHRTKKEHDNNKGKWIGVGGHVENNETILHAMKREIKEETGLDVLHYIYKGYVDFYMYEKNGLYKQRMYLYVVDKFQGELIECNEGDLKWIKKEKILSLNLWEGDKIFLKELDNKSKFHLRLTYKNDALIDVKGPKYI